MKYRDVDDKSMSRVLVWGVSSERPFPLEDIAGTADTFVDEFEDYACLAVPTQVSCAQPGTLQSRVCDVAAKSGGHAHPLPLGSEEILSDALEKCL